MANYQEILKHAQAGKLTEAELEEVITEFRSGIRTHPDRNTLVMVVGEAVCIDPSGRTKNSTAEPSGSAKAG